MHANRPGPRQAGFAAILFAVATLVAAADAPADTVGGNGPESGPPSYRSAVVDALDGEMAALSAISDSSIYARVAALHLNGTDTGAPWPAKAPPRGAVPLTLDGGVLAPVAVSGRLDGPTLDRVNVGERSAEWRCLSEAMYFEARGEGIQGQQAVAEVILNRVDSNRYPDTVCGVVRQGGGDGCQFSYFCDGKAERIGNRRVFDRIGKLAWLMLKGRERSLTDEALYFHSTAVHPSWSRKYVRTARIGRHVFYRPHMELSKN